MNAIDRLLTFQQSVRDKIGGQNKFESYIGISSGYISNMKKKDGAITSDVMIKIKNKFPELNLEWLITGDGNMLKLSSSEIILDTGKEQKYKDTIKELEAELNQLKGENRILREQAGLGERKVNNGKSA